MDMDANRENTGISPRTGGIDTVIFDIGGVLVELGRYRFLARRGFTGELASRIVRATMRSDDWRQLDLGILPDEKVLELFIENDPEIEPQIRHFFADFHGVVEPRESTGPWLGRVKAAGVRILYLSNFSFKIRRECSDALYFMPQMEGGIFSCDVNLIKPDPAIYRLLLDRYGLDPARCVFIDDTAENLVPAGELGLHTLLFEDPAQAERMLDEMLRPGRN